MKPDSSLFLTPVIAVALAGSSFGAVYFNNFESGYVLGDMDGQDGWSASDPAPDVGFIINAGGVWGSRTGTIGFVEPTSSASMYVSRAVTATPLIGDTNATFSVLFQIIDSDSGLDAARDSFGFRLENAVGDNLFSFHLTPVSQSGTPETTLAFHSYSWSSRVGGQTAVLPALAAEENFAYTFSVSFFNAGGGTTGFTADINGDAFSGNLGALNTEEIARLGATWDLFNDAGPDPYSGGSNFMLFDNISLIPEPSTAMLVAFAGLGLVTRRKRA